MRRNPSNPAPADAPLTPEGGCALQVHHLSKSFGGVVALDDVQLEVRAGEVHCLMGENGAGKSTLLRTLAGLLRPDAGEIRLRGEPCKFDSPRDAIARGVAMIHQELLPFPDLTVAENVLIGREPRGRFPGVVSHRQLQAQARALLEAVGAPAIAPGALMRDLSVSETQMVEIAKAVAREASIIIMDEPTSSLSHQETEALFRLIADLRARGTAVIYVSHKMDEILRIADRVTVLRDGRYIATRPIAALDEPKLISLMVGRTLTATRRQSSFCGAGSPPPAAKENGSPNPAGYGDPLHPQQSEVVLSVHGLTRPGKFSDISFSVRRGEVLGLAGLMGAGRTEVVSAIYGLAPADAGTVRIRGNPVRIDCPRDALRLGIGFVSEDRKLLGLNLGASIQHNITAGHISRCCRRGLIQHRAEAEVAEQNIRRYRIRAHSRHQPVGLLSGGNQQKVVIAKVLFGEPEILILDEPTRGIDIGAKREIYGLIDEWASAGRAIILVSSELPELLALSDRILVMRSGRISAELGPDQFSQEEILRHAMPD